MEDLEKAISIHREALTIRRQYFPSLSKLATALLLRSKETGRLDLLEDGILIYREALDLLSPPSWPPQRPSVLSNFACSL